MVVNDSVPSFLQINVSSILTKALKAFGKLRKMTSIRGLYFMLWYLKSFNTWSASKNCSLLAGKKLLCFKAIRFFLANILHALMTT